MKDIDLNKLKEDFSRMFGMMTGSTHPTTGRMVLAEKEMLRLLDFVTQIPVLIEQLEAAQRERGDAKEWVKTAERTMDHQAGLITSLGIRAEAAEAELKRRDAQEPVAWLAQYHGEVFESTEGATLSAVEAYAKKYGWEPSLTEIIALYTDARAAVLPPELTPADAECSLSAEQAGAWVSGANWMRDKALEMGCQPEKVVKLPARFNPRTQHILGISSAVMGYCVNGGWIRRDALIAALTAAGVKWVEGE